MTIRTISGCHARDLHLSNLKVLEMRDINIFMLLLITLLEVIIFN